MIDDDIGEIVNRVPPHSLESEAAVISAALNDSSCMARAATVLAPDQFYSEAHRRIWEACLELWRVGTTPDVVSVGTRLKDSGRLVQVGGMAYLTEALNAAPSLAGLDVYARTVAYKAQLRKLILACRKIELGAYAGVSDVPAFVDASEQSVYEIARQSTSRPMLSPLKETISAEFKKWQEYDAKVRSGEITRSVTGIPTGLDRLDNILAGLHRGDLTIVAGRPGMGKSALGVDIAIAVASRVTVESGKSSRRDVSAIFSMEMPKEQIADRAICSSAGVDLRKARTGDFDGNDWPKLVKSAGELAALDQLLVNDTPSLTLTQIRSMVREASSNAARSGRRLSAVVVDYLQLAVGDPGAGNREQEVASVSRGLKAMAKEMSVAVIALAQLSRKVEERSDKRPMLSDLRESGSIEQDADNIVFVYRDEYYNADTEDKGIAELVVAKQRNGPTGTVCVKFDAQYTRFSNLPDNQYGDAA